MDICTFVNGSKVQTKVPMSLFGNNDNTNGANVQHMVPMSNTWCECTHFTLLLFIYISTESFRDEGGDNSNYEVKIVSKQFKSCIFPPTSFS